MFSYPKWGHWGSEKWRNHLGDVGRQIQEPIPGLLTPSQCSSSSIRDVLKVAEDFPGSEWYLSWCSHRRCHLILSLDSRGQLPLSWVTSMLVGCFPVPSIGSGWPKTGTRRWLLERLYCSALTLNSLFHSWFPSGPPHPEAPTPPGHLQPEVPKLQSTFLLRNRQFSWDHALFSDEKWLWQKIPHQSPP